MLMETTSAGHVYGAFLKECALLWCPGARRMLENKGLDKYIAWKCAVQQSRKLLRSARIIKVGRDL